MSLEQQVTALVASANALTGAVNGKVGEIDLASQKLKADFAAFMADRERIGDGSAGSRRFNIYQNVLYEGKNYVPDSEKPVGWTPGNSNLYLHFKTKFNTLTKNGMFHFSIKGYAYGQSTIIDETFAGYSYVANNALTSVGTFGNHEPTVYRAPNGDIYLRIKALNLYFFSFYVDSMNVTGGLPAKGDISLIVSPNLMLNNY
ncbi:hypothetical protein HT094_22035 [Shewanella sp. ZOR0012]|uniref:hypothetical protein n=1 Tax=Shewanella sp. ZOR0012 TaxID=1339231 RepID=UPI000645AEDB|nr:hypothetical protein [Shewanella sp. ZOR0012]NSM26783.1 hypothetical protein [Shewanella sp. ZOR0012]